MASTLLADCARRKICAKAQVAWVGRAGECPVSECPNAPCRAVPLATHLAIRPLVIR